MLKVGCLYCLNSIPGPLLSLVYINDLHLPIKYSEPANFNHICVNFVNKQVYYDLKNVADFLMQTKIS